MSIFKKDFFFFLKLTLLTGVITAVLIVILTNINIFKIGYLNNFPSLLHCILHHYNVVVFLIGLICIARISVSERTHKTDIFLHALPVSATQAYIARWVSLWANLFLYTCILISSMLVLSYKKVSISPEGLFQLAFYLFCFLVLITSFCLLFEKFGRFRMIAYVTVIIALTSEIVSDIMKNLGVDKALITDNFNLLGNTPWAWQTIFVYMALSVAISGLAYMIQITRWTGIPKKLSFKEKYTSITAVIFSLIVMYSALNSESEKTLPKGAFSDADIISEVTLSNGNTTLTLVNPGQYTLDPEEQLKVNSLMALLKPEISSRLADFPTVLEDRSIFVQLTAAGMGVQHRDDMVVIFLPLEHVKKPTSATELKKSLVYEWLLFSCDEKLPLFAKSTNRDLIYFGLPIKESFRADPNLADMSSDQLRAFREHILEHKPEDWLNWHDFGRHLPSIMASWVLENIEQQVGRDTYIEWINQNSIPKDRDEASYAPLIGSSIFYEDTIQAVNYTILKKNVLSRLDQATSNAQKREGKSLE